MSRPVLSNLMRRTSRLFLVPLATLTVLTLVATACQYDPTGVNGPLGNCDGQAATHGYGFDPNQDPAGGSTHFATGNSDVIVVANGPVVVNARPGHDVICANVLGPTSGITVNGGPGMDDCRNTAGATANGCEFIDGIPNMTQVNNTLGRGINLGNMLEAPREGDWGLNLDASFFATIANEGFDHIRLPVSWAGYAATSAPYTIPTGVDATVVHPDYDNIWERVDWVLDLADDAGLVVVLNMHHYDEIHENPTAQQARFLAMWQQIATHYADAGNNVLFELLNEPHDAFDDNPALWNDLAADALAVVRSSNPTRPVLIGPVGYNSIGALDSLVLPNDPYLITTVHFYDPFPFTHQGAEWIDPVPPTGTTWDPDIYGLGIGTADYSWQTQVTGTNQAVLVDYDTQWAGFALDRETALDPNTLSFTVAGAGQLRVVCREPNEGETEVGFVTTTAGTQTYNLDLSTCAANSSGVFFQNALANSNQLAFTQVELCSNLGCEQLIGTATTAIDAAFAEAAAFGTANGTPVHVGEFGAYSADGASDLGDRADWTAAVTNAVDDNNMSSAYWEFAAGFGAYDLTTNTWITPLRDALLNE